MGCTEKFIENGKIVERDCYHGGPPDPREPGPPLARDAADMPGWLERLRNFAVASTKHVAAGMPMATDEEIVRRHDICLGCEHFRDNVCSQCGCPIARARGYVSKLSWAGEQCPVGKW